MNSLKVYQNHLPRWSRKKDIAIFVFQRPSLQPSWIFQIVPGCTRVHCFLIEKHNMPKTFILISVWCWPHFLPDYISTPTADTLVVFYPPITLTPGEVFQEAICFVSTDWGFLCICTRVVCEQIQAIAAFVTSCYDVEKKVRSG